MDTVGNFYAINSDGKLTKKSASEVSKFAKGESDEEEIRKFLQGIWL